MLRGTDDLVWSVIVNIDAFVERLGAETLVYSEENY